MIFKKLILIETNKISRQKYGIRPLNSIELLRTEEGLAALHTIMNANLKYLYLPALLYYLACMGDKMTFAQLFNHMGRYIEKPEERWKLGGIFL